MAIRHVVDRLGGLLELEGALEQRTQLALLDQTA